MDKYFDTQRRHATQLDSQDGKLRFATVTGYQAGMAQVEFQPEGQLSGWLPVLSIAVGAGWGMHVPLNIHDQVAVMAHEGNTDHGVILGRVPSDVAQPPAAAGADMVFRSKEGASISFMTAGTVIIGDPSGTTLTMENNGTATLAGTLKVTGDILDANGVHGSMATLRGAYNSHAHTNVQNGGGTSGTTNDPVT